MLKKNSRKLNVYCRFCSVKKKNVFYSEEKTMFSKQFRVVVG